MSDRDKEIARELRRIADNLFNEGAKVASIDVDAIADRLDPPPPKDERKVRKITLSEGGTTLYATCEFRDYLLVPLTPEGDLLVGNTLIGRAGVGSRWADYLLTALLDTAKGA